MNRVKAVRDTISKWMKNDKFKAAYKILEARYELVATLIKARSKAYLSQKNPVRRTQTTQPISARQESSLKIPIVTTLLKVARTTDTCM